MNRNTSGNILPMIHPWTKGSKRNNAKQYVLTYEPCNGENKHCANPLLFRDRQARPPRDLLYNNLNSLENTSQRQFMKKSMSGLVLCQPVHKKVRCSWARFEVSRPKRNCFSIPSSCFPDVRPPDAIHFSERYVKQIFLAACHVLPQL